MMEQTAASDLVEAWDTLGTSFQIFSRDRQRGLAVSHQQETSSQYAATYSAPIEVEITAHTFYIVISIRLPANMRPHALLAGRTTALNVLQKYGPVGALLVDWVGILRKMKPAFKLVSMTLDPELAGDASWLIMLEKGACSEFALRFERYTMLTQIRHVHL
jgi:hypothetical protein